MLTPILNAFSSPVDTFKKELLKQTLNDELLNKLLLKDDFSLSYKDENGNSFLNIAILKNKYKSAKWLLEYDINPLLKNNKGENSLSIAIKCGTSILVDLITNHEHLDIDEVDYEGRTYLQNAVILGEEKIVNILIKKGANVNNIDNHNRNVMFDAISYGNKNIINEIVSSPDIDLNLADDKGETILHKKEIINDHDLCKILIRNGADPTICDAQGRNLLCNMALEGMDGIDLIDEAINQGYSLNAPVKKNSTILMETLGVFYKLPQHEQQRRESLLNMASQLVAKGLDVNALNEYGENALFDAVRNNDYETCALLIHNKVDINKQNRLKQTPLLLACYKGIEALDIILLLLHNDANPNIKNELNQGLLEILNRLVLHTHKNKILSNSYILMYLNTNGQYLLIIKEILNNSKCNLQYLDSKNQPLFFAPLLFGNYELFKLYISNGFNINEKNKNGLNIFYVYIEFVFKVNRYFDKFRQMLIRLIQEKVDINISNKNSKTIFTEVINKNTNSLLYYDLIDTCRIDFNSTDKNGRTIMHHAILNKNFDIVKMLYLQDNEVINQADSYGILPITYATLIGEFEIVSWLLKNKNIYVKSNKKIPSIIKEKFKPMLDNINKLKDQTVNKDELRKINILLDQIRSDFKIKEEI